MRNYLKIFHLVLIALSIFFSSCDKNDTSEEPLPIAKEKRIKNFILYYPDETDYLELTYNLSYDNSNRVVGVATQYKRFKDGNVSSIVTGERNYTYGDRTVKIRSNSTSSYGEHRGLTGTFYLGEDNLAYKYEPDMVSENYPDDVAHRFSYENNYLTKLSNKYYNQSYHYSNENMVEMKGEDNWILTYTENENKAKLLPFLGLFDPEDDFDGINSFSNYYIGVLGNVSKKLPASIKYEDNSSVTYRYVFDSDGYPTKIECLENGNEEHIDTMIITYESITF